MLGLWVRPWKGEWVCGEVVAVSGDDLVCRAMDGSVFVCSLGQTPLDAYSAERPVGPPLSIPYRLTEMAN